MRLVPVLSMLLLAGCRTGAPQPGGGLDSDCAFRPGPQGSGLVSTCTIEGSVPNTLMDPLANGGSVCSASSWLLYDQQMTIRTRQEWGELGEDDNAQVRIGVTVEPPSSHQARLIKAVGGDCSQRTGPYGTVATIFDGNYSARVDKESVPACIFESRFVPAAFSQQISMVVPANVTSGTRAGTIRAIARRIDLEVAQAVNARINGNTPLSAEFVARAGRCDGNYEWMVEP